LPHAVADGPTNMAADETLLETAMAGIASLRFYGWSEATLSLGYFQPSAVRRADPRLAGLPWVRRPSGGGALVHHHELTYALALPPASTWQPRGASRIAFMHEVIAAALGELRVPVRVSAAEERTSDVLCFQHHTPGDLLSGPAKLVGSAQRKCRGTLLQHGGILLAASPFTPALPGIAECTGLRLDPADLGAALVRQLGCFTGWRVEMTSWTDAERRRTDELVRERYRTPAWNEKR
jgi:lipoate-protein ligase A